MCQMCVADGRMTVGELDEAVMAGDTSVIAMEDRILSGVDPRLIAVELLFRVDEPTAREILEALG